MWAAKFEVWPLAADLFWGWRKAPPGRLHPYMLTVFLQFSFGDLMLTLLHCDLKSQQSQPFRISLPWSWLTHQNSHAKNSGERVIAELVEVAALTTLGTVHRECVHTYYTRVCIRVHRFTVLFRLFILIVILPRGHASRRRKVFFLTVVIVQALTRRRLCLWTGHDCPGVDCILCQDDH